VSLKFITKSNNQEENGLRKKKKEKKVGKAPHIYVRLIYPPLSHYGLKKLRISLKEELCPS